MGDTFEGASLPETEKLPSPDLAKGRCLTASIGEQQPGCGTKLWLWKNGDHYLAYAHEYPTYGGGDPMTLGEPVGWAIFEHSAPPSRSASPLTGPVNIGQGSNTESSPVDLAAWERLILAAKAILPEPSSDDGA